MTNVKRLLIGWSPAALLVVLCCACSEQPKDHSEAPTASVVVPSIVEPGPGLRNDDPEIQQFGDLSDLEPTSIYSNRCGTADSEAWISPAASWTIEGHEIGETLEASGFKSRATCSLDGVCEFVDPRSVSFAFDREELFSIEVRSSLTASDLNLPLGLKLEDDLDETITRLTDARMGPWILGSNDGGVTTIIASNFSLQARTCWQYRIELTFADRKLVSLKLNAPIS